VASPSAFSKRDIRRTHEIAVFSMRVAQSPETISDPWLQRLSSDVIPGGHYERFALDVSPSTDDRPYFFFHARLHDVFLAATAFNSAARI